MDMFDCPEAVHKAVKTMTEYDMQIINEFGKIDGLGAVCWDYLWGNYACLGDDEYHEFEAQYAYKLNDRVRELGMASTVHNCADLPHLETQVRDFESALFSGAYYPQIEGSPSATDVIEQGYCDVCTMVGNVDPQVFMRNTAEETAKITGELCQEVKTSLCKRSLNSRFVISTGCEVPPGLGCRMENIEAFVKATEQYGKMEY